MENEQKVESTDESSAGQVAGGCLGMIVLIGIVLWVIISIGANSEEYRAIAKTQSIAMMLEVLEGSDGSDDLVSLVQSYPDNRREENVRQLVDFWFNSNKPMQYATPGIDADWLERKSAKRIVKREMVKFILDQAKE